LDGCHAGWTGQGNRCRLRGQIHAAMVVLGRGRCGEAHGSAPAQHAGRWHQEVRGSIINGGGKWVELSTEAADDPDCGRKGGCAFVVSPAPATSFTSPPLCRTSRRWRCV